MTGLSALAGLRSSFPRGGSHTTAAKALAIALAELEAVVEARFDGYIAGTSFGEKGLDHAEAWAAYLDERREYAAKSCQQRYGDEQFVDNDGVQKPRWKPAVELMVANYTRDMKFSRAFQIGWQEAAFTRTLE